MTLNVFALQNAPVNADVVRMAASAGIYSGGIVTTGDLAVTQTTVASMNLNVGPGRAWVPGTEVGLVTGGVWSRQGMYFVDNDASAAVSITASDPTNPRIDVVYLAVQDSAYSGSNNQPVLAVAAGTPAATPAVPSLPNNAIALAQVAVAANATSIVTANITTVAVGYSHPLGHMGRTAGFQTLSGATTIIMDAAQVLRGGVTFDNANDALVVPIKGLYRVNAQFYTSGGSPTGSTSGSVRVNGSNAGPLAIYWKGDVQDAAAHVSSILTLNASDKVTMTQLPNASGLNAWGTTGYNGCYLEVEYIGPA